MLLDDFFLPLSSLSMPDDFVLLAHGEIPHLIGKLFGSLILIVLAFFNAFVGIFMGGIVGWPVMRGRRVWVRIAVGTVVALLFFVVLWVVQALFFYVWMEDNVIRQ